MRGGRVVQRVGVRRAGVEVGGADHAPWACSPPALLVSRLGPFILKTRAGQRSFGGSSDAEPAHAALGAVASAFTGMSQPWFSFAYMYSACPSLAQVGLAVDHPRGAHALRQRREEQPEQDRDDADHDEQLDQRETREVARRYAVYIL